MSQALAATGFLRQQRSVAADSTSELVSIISTAEPDARHVLPIMLPKTAPSHPTEFYKSSRKLHCRNCAQLLMFARVFRIYGTEKPYGSLVSVGAHQRSTRKCQMRCQWETHNGYHHSSHHRTCHSAAWRRWLVRPWTLVWQVIAN
jgi:hypothetical protein